MQLAVPLSAAYMPGVQSMQSWDLLCGCSRPVGQRVHFSAHGASVTFVKRPGAQSSQKAVPVDTLRYWPGSQATVGSGVGWLVGSAVGTGLGDGVGSAVGCGVGTGVGWKLGKDVGWCVGSAVGCSVGMGLG